MKITSFLFIALTLVLAACAPVGSDDDGSLANGRHGSRLRAGQPRHQVVG